MGKYNVQVRTEDISALFNAILFVRALEDQRRYQSPNTHRTLIEAWLRPGNAAPKTLRSCIASSLKSLESPAIPKKVLDTDRLKVFDRLDRETVLNLFSDFYDNRFAPYKYDFSLMSKHALSRIYERYVSMLRAPKGGQPDLFGGPLPDEITDRALGGVYTPQYIARFFARFLKENYTPSQFRTLQACDPACGSGIFLRTLREMQCDPMQDGDLVAITQAAFASVLGVDVDPNACEATRLSLSLLHLVLTSSFPALLAIEAEEASKYVSEHPELSGHFDAILANPPFTKWNDVPLEWRDRVAAFMSGYHEGKVGLFLAMLKLGLDLVKPGGFLLYVLPHSFLIAESASPLRKEIATTFWVRFLVDLHNVSVFEDVGSYVILLVIQKKSPYLVDSPRAVLIRCTDFVGHALQEALVGKRASNDFYDIYEVDQAQFDRPKWRLLSPVEAALEAKLAESTTLGDFVFVRKGFITGANDVFIVNTPNIPEGEEAIYRPFLSDREMRRYSVPRTVGRAVFYPYLNGSKVDEQTLRERFPKTWERLASHRPTLEDRKAVKAGNLVWWCPERSRNPQRMFRPKIVSPHLVLLPRFSLDDQGKYAVSQCPILYPKAPGDELGMLKYFVAVLNSPVAHWQIMNQSHKYSRGYAMLERNTLDILRVPNPTKVNAGVLKRIETLVDDLIARGSNPKAEAELDKISAELYGLTRHQRRLIGMEE